MRFSIITIFPEIIEPYISESIVGRAKKDGVISVFFYNPRDFAANENADVDDSPYGGGPGMVMQAEPILKAVDTAREKTDKDDEGIFLTSARGRQFDAEMSRNIQKNIDHTIIICGRYEGVDRRVLNALDATEVSVGPYILTGGELPALIMLDAVSRQIPGVLGNDSSLENKRTAGSHTYTRPETIEYRGEKYSVPDILLSGHHEQIKQWREQKAGKDNKNNHKTS